MIKLERGQTKKISEVVVGGRVSVGSGELSTVFMFTHKDSSVRYDFVELQVEGNKKKLRLTEVHFLTLNGRYVPAGTAQMGDIVELGTGGRVTSEGLYDPRQYSGFRNRHLMLHRGGAAECCTRPTGTDTDSFRVLRFSQQCTSGRNRFFLARTARGIVVKLRTSR